MEIIKATVTEVGEKHFIKVLDFALPLSDDKATEVKSAFNKLIARIKDGPFQIELESECEDLFSQVAKEYIAQLNREIQEVRKEMQTYGLVTVAPLKTKPG